MKTAVVILVAFASSSEVGAQTPPKTWPSVPSVSWTANNVIEASTIKPTIVIISPDGRTATIDFGGKEVTYSGNLPVSGAAKMFFEAFRSLAQQVCLDQNTKAVRP